MKTLNDRTAFYEYIGSRLRHYRRAAGMNQKAVAAILDVSPAQYQKYESGSNKVPLDVVLAICEHFGVVLDAVVPTLRGGQRVEDMITVDLANGLAADNEPEADVPGAEEIIRINTAFSRIGSARKRRILIELIESF